MQISIAMFANRCIIILSSLAEDNMIISKAYAKRLIKSGKARYTNFDEANSRIHGDREDQFFVCIDRIDLQRVDHYAISR